MGTASVGRLRFVGGAIFVNPELEIMPVDEVGREPALLDLAGGARPLHPAILVNLTSSRVIHRQLQGQRKKQRKN